MKWRKFLKRLGFSPPKITKTLEGMPELTLQPTLYIGHTQEALQDAIDNLQEILLDKGLIASKTRRFDQDTKAAVEEFQRQNDLRVDGVVGPLTWSALLYPTLSYFDAVPAEFEPHVRKLQHYLYKERLLKEINGVFDRQTSRSVRRFQRRYGLLADGVCGPITWSFLLGQRLAWGKGDDFGLPPWIKSLFLDQAPVILALFAGIHFTPLEEGQKFTVLETVVIAYSLICVAQPILNKISEFLPIQVGQDLAFFRFSQYVLVGFFWRHILHWVKTILL